jgi:hypothetical protein
MNSFTFNPFGGVIPLWTTATTTPAGTASFDFTSLTTLQQPGDNTLKLIGTGMLHLTGYADTPGTFTFTANQDDEQTTFSFSSSNSAQPPLNPNDTVPDGGLTVMLLGASLSALGLVRRKLA